MPKRSLSPDASADAVPFATAVVGLAPPAKFEDSVREALAAVDTALRKVFGDEAYIVPFGSLVQGVHLNGSDLDLCVHVPGGEDPVIEGRKPDNTKQVAALKRFMGNLPRPTFRVIETRFWKHMRVPILILGHAGSGGGDEIEADISVGVEFDGVEKGFTDRLVRRVLAQCPRALHTVRIVKLWAKVEKLNKAYDGFLNALGWTLLVLYFFMQRGEVTSSALNDEEPNEKGSSEGLLPPPLIAGPGDEPDSVDTFDAPGPEDIADFFDWVTETVSTWPEAAEGTAWGISLVDNTISEVPPPKQQYADQSSLFIEDPGIRMTKGTSENVARSLKVAPWKASMDKCTAAAKTLRDEDPAAADAWVAALLRRVADEKNQAAQGHVGQAWPQAQKRPWPGPMQNTQMQMQMPRGQKGQSPAWQKGGPQPPQQPPPWQKGGQQQQVQAAPWQNAQNAFGNQAKRPRMGGAPMGAPPCQWFRKGQCWDGTNCKLSHG